MSLPMVMLIIFIVMFVGFVAWSLDRH